jgi:hypothetical protein
MKYIDRYLQKVRMRVAMKHLGNKVRLIDIGAHRGEMFDALGPRLEQGFGIEPRLSDELRGPRYVIKPGWFPATMPEDTGVWDGITMLAVLEHISHKAQGSLADACYALLKPRGRVVITVPSPAVDPILAVLKALRLIDGMSLEEHHGFEPSDTVNIFPNSQFKLVKHARFQFGLNNLYVFEKKAEPGA